MAVDVGRVLCRVAVLENNSTTAEELLPVVDQSLRTRPDHELLIAQGVSLSISLTAAGGLAATCYVAIIMP